MENVNFGVVRAWWIPAGAWTLQYAYLVLVVDVITRHPCKQYIPMPVDSRLRDASTQVIQYRHSQATNYIIESVPPRPYPI